MEHNPFEDPPLSFCLLLVGRAWLLGVMRARAELPSVHYDTTTPIGRLRVPPRERWIQAQGGTDPPVGFRGRLRCVSDPPM